MLVEAAADAGRHFARLGDKDAAVDNYVLDKGIVNGVAFFL